MPRELITIQVGQCGNQIGCRFWDLALREHAAQNKGGLFDEAFSSFFRNVDTRYTDVPDIPLAGGTNPIGALRARAKLRGSLAWGISSAPSARARDAQAGSRAWTRCGARHRVPGGARLRL